MNEIQLYSELNRSPEALEKLGMVLGRSGNFGFSKVEQGVTMMAICVTERMTPLQFLRTFHVMPDGKFTKKAGAALAEFETMGGTFEWKESGDGPVAKEDDRKAVGYFKSKSGREITYSYSIADAKREGLLKDGSRWLKRPGSMLRARVITNALGMIEPSIFFGETEDGDATGYTPAELNLAAQEAKPVEVAVVVEPVKPVESKVAPATDEKELAAQGLAPSQPPATATGIPASSEPFKASTDANGLTAQTVARMGVAIGEKNQIAVSAWLSNAKWISNNDLRTLSVSRAQKIIDKPQAFLKHCKIIS